MSIALLTRRIQQEYDLQRYSTSQKNASSKRPQSSEYPPSTTRRGSNYATPSETTTTSVRHAAVLLLGSTIGAIVEVRFWALEDREEIAINRAAFAGYVTEYCAEGINCQQWNHYDRYQIQMLEGGIQRAKLKVYRNIDSGLSTLKHQVLWKELIVQDYAAQSAFLLRVNLIRQTTRVIFLLWSEFICNISEYLHFYFVLIYLHIAFIILIMYRITLV